MWSDKDTAALVVLALISLLAFMGYQYFHQSPTVLQCIEACGSGHMQSFTEPTPQGLPANCTCK